MLNVTLDSLGLETVRGDESFVSRVQDMPVSKEEFFDLTKMAKYVGVTEQFKDVINTFHTPEGETPAGFKRELVMEKDGVQPLRLAGFVGRQHTAVFTFQFFPGHAGIGSHIDHPFGILTSFTCILYVRSPKNATSYWAKIHFSPQKSRNL